MNEFSSLPPDLPVPEDDGAADHLEELEIPAGLAFPSTFGDELDLMTAGGDGRLVAYVYPRTGTPGVPLIEGWDDIPGARGCTPQSCAYRDSMAEFAELDTTVVGISAQTQAEQAEFATREHIPFPLLSDDGLVLAEAIGLPTFEAGGLTLYRRLTLILVGATIAKCFYPVFPPDRDAAVVLAWLREDDGGPEPAG